MNGTRSILAVLLSLVSSPVAGEEAAGVRSPARLVIVQPGYPGSTQDAAGFLERLSKYLEDKTGIKGVSGTYFNEEKPALAACQGGAQGAPGLGVVSLGFYLKHRKRFDIRPLLQSLPKDNFVLVARAGDVKGLDDLKGQPVAGGPLHEAELLGRIALAGKADPAAWDQKPTLGTSRTLRDLVDRKKYRAVVLTGRDYRAFQDLYRTKGLEKIWESEYYPPAFLVAFLGEDAASARKDGKDSPRSGEPRQAAKEVENKEVEKAAKAFAGLRGDPRGKEILETMAADGFEAIAADWLKEVEGRYDASTGGGDQGGREDGKGRSQQGEK